MRRPREKKVRSWRKLKRDTPASLMPIAAGEWVLEKIVNWLGRLAIIDLIRIVGGLSLVWVAVSYAMSASERREAAESQLKAKHYQAWQVINSASGMISDSGRSDALRDLIDDGVSLLGIKLASANLPGIDLSDGQLQDADMTNVIMLGGCFKRANLLNANMSNGVFDKSDFEGATLLGAKMKSTQLFYVSFDNADLSYADLRDAIVPTRLMAAKSIKGANIYGASAPSNQQDFFQKALKAGAVCISSDGDWEMYLGLLGSPMASRRIFTERECNPRFIEPQDMTKLTRHGCDNFEK
jgi:hypothetical protein